MIATIPVGSAPVGVAVTPDGTRAYVANLFADDISVVNTITNTVTATILVGPHPRRIAITPDGARAYVTHVSNGISVIDTATNTVTAVIPIAAPTFAIAITSDGARAWVTTYPEASLALTLRQTRSLPS